MEYHRGVLIVEDLGSKSGMLFLGKPKSRLELKQNASFFLGRIEIIARKSISLTQSKPEEISRKKVFFRRREVQSRRVPFEGTAVSVTFQEEFVKALKRMPFLGFSLLLHLLILFFVSDLPYFSRRLHSKEPILAHIVTPDDLVKLEQDVKPEEDELDPPDPLEEEFPDPFIDFSDDEDVSPQDIIEYVPGQIAIEGLVTGRRDFTGFMGEGTARLMGRSFSRGFKDYITDLRMRGMDVAFVIDCTNSMDPFLDEAKRVVDRLVSNLAAVVPNLKLSLVSFRDEGDEYVTRHIDLTTDRYEILNFLDDCMAEGGGDFPEAVCEALNRTINTLFWRASSKKVIILIGDAPAHKEDGAMMDRLLREFTKGEGPGVVNTVYIGPLTDPPTVNQEAAVESMKHIAHIAKGEFSWISEYNKLSGHLISSAFGFDWKDDVARLLRSVQKNRMDLLIERKAKAKQKGWLLGGLKKTPVMPGIVKALITLSDARDLEHLVGYLETDLVSDETKRASLYILRKVLEKPVTFSLHADPRKQQKEVEKIREAIREYSLRSD